MLYKSFDSTQEHVQPEDSDLAAIRKYALRDVKDDEVWTGRTHLANDRVDRAHERFPLAYLERFAQTLPGKSLLGGHDYSTLPLGRFYSASVQKDAQGYYLQADYYVRADSPLVPSIELGVLSAVSVGYNAGKRVCDLCEKAWSPYGMKDGCEHWPGGEFDGKTCTLTYCPTEAHKAEAMEGSFVWAGCQYGAEAVPKNAEGFEANQRGFLLWLGQRLSEEPRGAKSMPTVEEVQAELQQAKSAHEKALGELSRQVAELKAAAQEGQWGREYLAAQIVKMATLLGKGDSYGVVLKALGENPKVEQLKPIWEEVGKEFDARFPPVQGFAGSGDPPPPPQGGQSAAVPAPWYRPRRAA